MFLKNSEPITVALDGTGGDRGSEGIVGAVRFAFAMYPALKLIIYGPSSLQDALIKSHADAERYDFVLAPQAIPQDEEPRRVLKYHSRSAMAQALQAVKDGRAHAMISGGGTGPLVALSRHILGITGHVRPALCARMPAGPGRFAMMLDLGANATATASDLYGFARLGAAASEYVIEISSPRLALLNIGTEQGKGPEVIRKARDLIGSDPRLNFMGFIEPNRIFSGDADIIVTDGFTGNIALKAAEGVAGIYTSVSGVKRFFSRFSHPDWLIPWQYNGSLLLGVKGIVIKSHGAAGNEAMAIAMVEAARAASCNLGVMLSSSPLIKPAGAAKLS